MYVVANEEWSNASYRYYLIFQMETVVRFQTTVEIIFRDNFGARQSTIWSNDGAPASAKRRRLSNNVYVYIK